MSDLVDQFGADRYKELSRFFIDNPGDRGPAGGSNTLVAKETRYKALGQGTNYTGLTHTITAGELTTDDTILFHVWSWPFSTTTHDLQFYWEDSFGTLHATIGFSLVSSAASMVLSYMPDPSSSNIIIVSTMNTIAAGTNTTTAAINVGEDWIARGGAVKVKITNAGPIVISAGSRTRAYYYRMKK